MIGKVNCASVGTSEAYAYIRVAYQSGTTCTCSNGSVTLTATETPYVFFVPSSGSWVVSITDGTTTSQKTVSITSKNQVASIDIAIYNLVGGRIFYDNGSNGATYTFYDSSKNILTSQTIANLAIAYYYSVVGTPSNDRWYVYNNNSNYPLRKTLWGASGYTTGTASGIGTGRTNTATMLSTYSTVAGTMWTYLRDTINANNVNGCNDWYVPSLNELKQLYNSQLYEDLFDDYSILSSSEYNSARAYRWSSASFSWVDIAKTATTGYSIDIRSF